MGSAPLRNLPLSTRAKLKKFFFPAILIASAAMRMFRLDAQGLWFDETYTAFVAGQTPGRMMQYLITDGVHPPLYYAGMAVWIRLFGDSVWSLRLPSVIFGVLAVWVTGLLVRRMAGEWEARVAASLLAFSPFLAWYSQDARMYSMECLAAVTAVYCFWMFLQNPNIVAVIGLCLSHAILYGTQYFGAFLFIAEGLFLVLYWRKYIRRWLPFLAAQIVAFAPLMYWVYLLLHRPNGSFGIGWIPKPDLSDPLLTLVNFMTAGGGVWNLAAFAAGAVMLVLLGAALFRGQNPECVGFAVFWLVIPVGMAWAVSQQLPVYIDRYLILSLPALVLLLTIGVRSISGWKAASAGALLAAAMLPGLWNIYLPAEGYRKEGWKSAAESLQAQFVPGDLLLLRVYQEVVPLQYYGMLDRDWKVIETNGVVELPQIDEQAGKCYFVYWWPSQSAHSFGTPIPSVIEEPNPLVRQWVEENLAASEMEVRFPGVIILRLEPVEK
jgi:mannosyltransferase